MSNRSGLMDMAVLAVLATFAGVSTYAAEGPGAAREAQPEIRLYDGPRRPESEVFVLRLHPDLTLVEIDGAPVSEVAREYHLLPGDRHLKVLYRKWSPISGTALVEWEQALLPQAFPMQGNRRGILSYRTHEGSRIEPFLELLGPKELDGPWTGEMACEACPGCARLPPVPLLIEVRDSAFVVAPDAGPRGQGRISAESNMMIRRLDRDTFSFFGTFREGRFELRGHRGTAACRIVLRKR